MEAADKAVNNITSPSKGVRQNSILPANNIFPSHNSDPNVKNNVAKLSDSGKKKATAKMQCSIKLSMRYFICETWYVIYTYVHLAPTAQRSKNKLTVLFHNITIINVCIIIFAHYRLYYSSVKFAAPVQQGIRSLLYI